MVTTGKRDSVKDWTRIDNKEGTVPLVLRSPLLRPLQRPLLTLSPLPPAAYANLMMATGEICILRAPPFHIVDSEQALPLRCS